MIRVITPEDKEQVLGLVQMFFKECMEQDGVFYSPEQAGEHFDIFVNNPGTLVLVAEVEGELVGLIAGVASAILFAKELAMQEMIWYVKPTRRRYGLKLLYEFEKRSTELGLQCVLATGFSGSPVTALYLKKGYRHVQNIFMKRLE